jgi:hypothetical protein
MSYDLVTRAKLIGLPEDEKQRLTRIAADLSNDDRFMELHNYPMETEILCLVYEKEYEKKTINDYSGFASLGD